MGFYWRRRRRGGVRWVPDGQPQHVDCCENLLDRRTQNQSLLGKLLSTTQNKPCTGADTFSLYIINLGIWHVRIRVPTGQQKPTQHGS
ncbi:hypothetical protein M405DRAFT_127836 [Rhizopogon salebrosus TDB-379]|nr:hypothetical protein M405DRAFT_127836 [Rhizopogon salebrosus TDB-379]